MNNPRTLCGRPLTFGDRAQINALKKLREKAEKEEERRRKHEAGELNKYTVTVSVSGSTEITVEAVDEEEAEELALEEVSINDSECDFEIEKIRLAKLPPL